MTINCGDKRTDSGVHIRADPGPRNMGNTRWQIKKWESWFSVHVHMCSLPDLGSGVRRTMWLKGCAALSSRLDTTFWNE